MKKLNVKKLTVSAIMIALATVLSLIPFIKMPLGGSLTPLSMLPICLIAITFGTKWGILCAFLYSLIQLGIDIGPALSWGLTPQALAGTIAFDYIVPFTLLGFSGIFANKGKIGAISGIALSLIGRFLCHFTTGIIIFDIWCEWQNVPLYSLCYNGAYMLPELILTTIGAFFLLSSKSVKKLVGIEQ